MKKQDVCLTGLDLTKLIAAVMIVLLHSGIIYTYSYSQDLWLTNVVTRWAVPFFFMASGYFMPADLRKLLRYILRILVWDVVWTLLYILLFGTGWDGIWDKVFPDNTVVVPFWYFPSLLACMVLVYLGKKVFRGNYTVLLVLAALLYLGALLGDAYSGLCPDNPLYQLNNSIWGGGTRNGFLFGTLFVCLGSFLHDCRYTESFLRVVPRAALVCGVVLFFLFAAFEATLFDRFQTGVDFNVTLFSVPFALSIFLLSLQCRIPRSVSLVLRKLSTLLFIVHWFFVQRVPYEAFQNSALRFCLILALSLLASAAILLLSKIIKPLAYLF